MSKKLLFLTSFILFAMLSFAQTRTAKGNILDEGGKPVQGVSVIQKGSKTGTQTDKDGNFSLPVTGTGNVTINFSSVGFVKQTETFSGANMSVKLVRADLTQDEVVVVGYSSVKKKELTASVSSINSKDLKDNPTNSAAEALAGKLAGVQVTVSEGAPGADVDLFVRGRNSITQSGAPLYIVDGIQLDNALSVLSPQDIENITVLKDAASTAIYGARGSNGVVLITTKGGRNTGGKTTVTYNAFYGISKLPQELEFQDPYNFVLWAYERAKYTLNPTDTAVAAQYVGRMSNYDTIKNYQNYPGTIDWQDRVLGRNARQSTQNLAVNGGTAATQYNLSTTWNKQEGLLEGSNYDRKLASFRFDHKAGNALKVGFNVRYNIQSVDGAGTSDAAGAGTSRLRSYTRYRPFLLAGQAEDSYDATLDGRNPGNGLREINPLQQLASEYRNRTTTAYNYSGYANLQITKNISFRSTFGYDVNRQNLKGYDDTLTSTSRSFSKLPIATIANNDRYTINNSNVVTYAKNNLFKTKHSVNVFLGQEIYQTKNNLNSQEVRYFPVGVKPDIAFNNLGLASPPAGVAQPKPTSSEVTTRQLSFFSSLKYDYNKKYFVTFNFRADGSSLFGPDYSSTIPLTDSTNRKWGYFPSVALAWRISQEKFMQQFKFISDAKIRLSIGQAGNNRINPYGFTTGYLTPPLGGYGLSDALAYTLVTPSRLGNAVINWETLESKNVGLDLDFLKGRITFTADFYSNVTKDLLIENKFPATSGYSTQYQNVGSVRNIGTELQVNATVLRKKDFTWSVNANVAFNKNKILSLGSNQQFTASSGWFNTGNPDDYILKVGGQVGTMYGLINDGFYGVGDFDATPYALGPVTDPQLNTQYKLKAGIAVPDASVTGGELAAPGIMKFRDINGDGKITLDDRIAIGNALPKYTGGFNQNFAYKNFDVSVFTNFSVGNDIYNANKLEFSNAYGVDANMLAIMNGRWRVIDGSGNSIQRVYTPAPIGGVNQPPIVIGVDPATLSSVNAGAKIWQPSRTTSGFNPMSYAVEDGSFLRINNITLGYTLPKKLISKAKMTSFRVYATINNVATLTGYSGYDPDVNTKRSNALTPGVDYAGYPRSRTFIAGLNVSF